MRRVTTIASMFASLAAAFLSGAANGQNLLSDPGFEQPVMFVPGGPGAAPGTWTVFNTGAPAGTTLSAESTSMGTPAPRNGAAKLRLLLDGSTTVFGLGYNQFVGVSQRVNGIVAGQDYTLTLYAARGPSTINGEFEFRVEWVDSSGSFIGNPFDPADAQYNTVIAGSQLTGAYQRFQLSDIAPAGAVACNVSIAVQSFSNDGQSAALVDVSIDDAELTTNSGGVSSEVVLFDDFNAPSLNTGIWFQPTGPGSFLGRTQMRPPNVPIEVSGGTAKLVVDTFNPTGLSFYGSEIRTVQVFPLLNGLIFETRSRWVDGAPGGLVGSLFSFATNGNVRDEIDFELITNQINQNGDDLLFTNVFSDDDFSQGGFGADVAIDGFELTDFNIYRVEWLPDRVDWFVNDVLVRRVTTVVPDGVVTGNVVDPQRIHLNAWAPDSDFLKAFNFGILPTPNPGDNERWTYEVDYVQISRPIIDCSDADIASPFGFLDEDDVFAMLTNIFFAFPEGDFNQNGSIDFIDLIDYLVLYDEGCVL